MISSKNFVNGDELLIVPFFEDITITVRSGLEDHHTEAPSLEKNPFYFPEFIDFLLERFMPYCLFGQALFYAI